MAFRREGGLGADKFDHLLNYFRSFAAGRSRRGRPEEGPGQTFDDVLVGDLLTGKVRHRVGGSRTGRDPKDSDQIGEVGRTERRELG